MTDRAALVTRLRERHVDHVRGTVTISADERDAVCDALAAQEALDADVQRGQALIDGLADDDPPATLTREQAETRLTRAVVDQAVNEWHGYMDVTSNEVEALAALRRHVLAALFPHDGSRP